MSYDDVMLKFRTFGPYQRRIFLVLCLPIIAGALHKLGGAFISARAEFRCLLPHESLENATYHLLTNITNATDAWGYGDKNLPQCERYESEIINSYDAPNENVSSSPRTVKCESFVYDKTYYTRTATTEFNLVCDNAWLKTLSDSLFMLGDVPGVVICGALSDRYGRKPVLLWGGIVQLVCGLLIAVSPNFNAFATLRILIGSVTSSLLVTAYVTAVEMVSPLKRTKAGVMMSLSFTGGNILSSCLAYFIRTWRYLQVAFAVPTLLLLAFLWSIPESVRWLLTKGHVEEAKNILRKAAAENGVELPPGTLDGLSIENTESERVHGKKSFFDLFRYPNLRKKTLVLFTMWFAISVTYYGLSLNTFDLGGNHYLIFVIAAIVELPAFTFLVFTLDKWGRKTILCGAMLLTAMSLLFTFFVPGEMTWLIKTLAMIGKLAITCCYGTIYIFAAELFPTEVRNVGVGACSSVSRIASALAPYLHYLFEISTYLPLVLLGACAFIAGLLSLLLPETLNKKLLDTIEQGEHFGKNTSDSKTKIDRLNHGATMQLLNGREIKVLQKEDVSE